MKLTCLSKGNGDYHFPPSHILQLSGFRLLVECPLDLSAVTVFSPLNTTTHPTDPLIKSTPFYKTPRNLHLWEPSLIDAVLVSSPAGMLGLPFLTRGGRFKGRVYATEATVKIGRMMMEELVEMHGEFVRFYGPERGEAEWLKWEEVEKMDASLRKTVVGSHGEELGSWMPLYRSSSDNEDESGNYLIDSSVSLEEINKINFICSCAVDSLNEGGSVLIPIGRLGIVLLLLVARRIKPEVVHLLDRWHADSRCLLILEHGIDAETALLPFGTMGIKVLQ